MCDPITSVLVSQLCGNTPLLASPMRYDEVMATVRKETNPKSQLPLLIPSVFFSAQIQKNTEMKSRQREMILRFDEVPIVKRLVFGLDWIGSF